MAKVIIPTPLRKFTNNDSKVVVGGATVLEAVQNLAQKFPSLEPYLLSENEIKPFIRLFKGDDDIETLDGGATPLVEEDILSIIPAIAGGLV
jgi:molybdopterin converting factor small subunit